MTQYPPERPTPWWPLLALSIGVTLLNVSWHATHAAPVVTGHRTLIEGVNQLAAFKADFWGHLADLSKAEVLDHIFSFFNLSAAIPIAVLGRTQFAMLFVSTLYLLLLVLSVHGIVRRLRPGAGALAAAAAALSPAAMTWSRVYSPFIAVMAVTAAGVYLLVRSNGLTRPLPALAFAAVAALSLRLGETVGEGLQMQLVFGVVGGYTFAVSLIRPEGRRRRVLVIGAAAVAMYAASLNWPYVTRVFSYTEQEAVTFRDSRYSFGSVTNQPLAWLAYASLIWHEHFGYALSTVVAGALGVALWRPKRADGFGLVFLYRTRFLGQIFSLCGRPVNVELASRLIRAGEAVFLDEPLFVV